MDALSTLLQQTQHLSDTSYYSVKLSGDWSYSVTSSEVIYFYLVQAGSFYISVGEISRKIYAGDIVMICNTHKHVCYALNHHGNEAKPLDKTLFKYNQDSVDVYDDSSQNVQLILVECQYDKELLQPLLSTLPSILPEHDDMHESKFKALDVAVRFITLESKYERLGKMVMMNLWASIVMVECLRTYIESLPETSDNWLLAMKDPHLSKALAIMHDKPNHNWTTHDLANEAGMSRSRFTERFRETVGVPPLTYLTKYRLRIAAHHLRLQKSSIAQISEMVGYASNSTFSQAFKREYDMSPKTYQQQQVAMTL